MRAGGLELGVGGNELFGVKPLPLAVHRSGVDDAKDIGDDQCPKDREGNVFRDLHFGGRGFPAQEIDRAIWESSTIALVGTGTALRLRIILSIPWKPILL